MQFRKVIINKLINVNIKGHSVLTTVVNEGDKAKTLLGVINTRI